MGITPLGFRDYVFNARAILLNAKEMPFSFNARALQLIHWTQVPAAALSKTAIPEAQGARLRRRLPISTHCPQADCEAIKLRLV